MLSKQTFTFFTSLQKHINIISFIRPNPFWSDKSFCYTNPVMYKQNIEMF